MPSKPSDSIRTVSPMSKDRLPALLVLRPKVSEARLAGRGKGTLAPGALRAEELIAEDVDATDGGRPMAKRRPAGRGEEDE